MPEVSPAGLQVSQTCSLQGTGSYHITTSLSTTDLIDSNTPPAHKSLNKAQEVIWRQLQTQSFPCPVLPHLSRPIHRSMCQAWLKSGPRSQNVGLPRGPTTFGLSAILQSWKMGGRAAQFRPEDSTSGSTASREGSWGPRAPGHLARQRTPHSLLLGWRIVFPPPSWVIATPSLYS